MPLKSTARCWTNQGTREITALKISYIQESFLHLDSTASAQSYVGEIWHPDSRSNDTSRVIFRDERTLPFTAFGCAQLNVMLPNHHFRAARAQPLLPPCTISHSIETHLGRLCTICCTSFPYAEEACIPACFQMYREGGQNVSYTTLYRSSPLGEKVVTLLSQPGGAVWCQACPVTGVAVGYLQLTPKLCFGDFRVTVSIPSCEEKTLPSLSSEPDICRSSMTFTVLPARAVSSLQPLDPRIAHDAASASASSHIKPLPPHVCTSVRAEWYQIVVQL